MEKRHQAELGGAGHCLGAALGCQDRVFPVHAVSRRCSLTGVLFPLEFFREVPLSTPRTPSSHPSLLLSELPRNPERGVCGLNVFSFTPFISLFTRRI